jgi:SPP1 family predicted phage head-tail adaptor
MTLVNASDLADMRADQQLLMPDTCTITTKGTASSDGYGGTTWGVSTTTTSACRVVPSSGREAQIAAKITALMTWTVTLPYNAVVTERDTLTVNGKTFQVASVLSGGSTETARRLICTEVS